MEINHIDDERKIGLDLFRGFMISTGIVVVILAIRKIYGQMELGLPLVSLLILLDAVFIVLAKLSTHIDFKAIYSFFYICSSLLLIREIMLVLVS